MTNLSDLIPAGGGQNNTDFVADGSITSGKPVALQTDGKVKQVSATANPASAPGGSATDLTTTMNGGGKMPKIEFDPHNSNKCMAAFIDGNGYQNLRIGTYSGTTVTWGTTVVVLSDYIGLAPSFCFDPVNENEIVIIIKETGSDYRILPATISGTSITLGTKEQFESSTTITMTAGMIAMDPASSTRQGVVVFVKSTGDYCDFAFTVSGTGGSASITKGTITPRDTNCDPMDYTSVIFNSSGTFIANGKADASLYIFGYAGTLSTTTITAGTQVGGLGNYTQSNLIVDPNAPTKVILGYYVSATSYKILVGTLSGTGNRTLTWATSDTTDVTTSEEYDSVSLAFNPANSGSFVMAYTNVSDSYYQKARLCSYSSTTVTVGSELDMSDVSSGSSWVAFDKTSGLFAQCYKDTNTNQQTEVIQGTDSSSNVGDLIGIAAGAISGGATGTINTWGSRNEAQSSLTIGSDYYVQTDGTITTASGGTLIGKAISATQINIKDYTG